jgi:membrane protease YdiL (CAAX protease family)
MSLLGLTTHTNRPCNIDLSSPRAWYAAAAITVFVLTTQLNSLLKALGVTEMLEWRVVLSIRNALEVTICLAGVAPVGRALVFAFIAPFAEEVLFRGFMFRQLYRRARLGFWISALLPSALFAAAHLYQSRNLGEMVGILAVTGLGGIGFCWVFMRWQDNLWAVFGLHALMNLWWEVFAVDDTALGGWLANGARLLTIALAILLTIYKDKIWKPTAMEAKTSARRLVPSPACGGGLGRGRISPEGLESTADVVGCAPRSGTRP